MIFDFASYRDRLADFQIAYRTAEEFPHIVIDHFLPDKILADAAMYFPPMDSAGWTHYKHFNENKVGLNKRDAIPPPLRDIIDALNTPDFVAWLSTLTGIAGLKPDPTLEGGGLHQIARGGFLNIHADFTVHPHRRMWRRRVNLLLYLNPDWQADYGGALELWTRDMKRPFNAILPLFNRCVIFNTDADSYHGHPSPLTCPPERTRRSIALYYFTEEATAPVKAATNYRARPGDGVKAVGIWLDKKALAVYNRLKGVLGIDDAWVSKMLAFLSRRRR